MADVKELLTKKIGPVPVVVIVAGAAAAFAVLGRRASGGDSFIPTSANGSDGNDPLSNVTDELGNLTPYDPILGAGEFSNWFPNNPTYIPTSGQQGTTTGVVPMSANSSTGTAATKPAWYDYLINSWSHVRDRGIPKGYGYQGNGRYIAAIDPSTGLPVQTAPDFIDYGVATIPGSPKGMTQGMTVEDWLIQSDAALATPEFQAEIEAEKSRVAPGQSPTGVGPGGVLIYGEAPEDLSARMAEIQKSIVVVPTAAEATTALSSDNGSIIQSVPTYRDEYSTPAPTSYPATPTPEPVISWAAGWGPNGAVATPTPSGAPSTQTGSNTVPTYPTVTFGGDETSYAADVAPFYSIKQPHSVPTPNPVPTGGDTYLTQ